jgi:hypothetical protein
MLTTLKKNSVYAVYSEEKYVSSILNSVQKIIEYQGLVEFRNNNSIYTRPVDDLKFNIKKYNFEQSIRRIYGYLKNNNHRFDIFTNF